MIIAEPIPQAAPRPFALRLACNRTSGDVFVIAGNLPKWRARVTDHRRAALSAIWGTIHIKNAAN